MEKVGAIWIVSGDTSIKIDKAFDGRTLRLYVTERANRWMGAIDGMFDFGLGSDIKDYSLPLGEDTQLEQWNKMHDALLDGRLGPPAAGYSRIYEEIVGRSDLYLTNICLCDMQTLGARGCVSNRGLLCPARVVKK